ncbi:MAG: hypothetical protein IIC50_24375 [Planctomycetes bacterium]|nr:hypothetical protein [Planctomycetota bacterium]
MPCLRKRSLEQQAVRHRLINDEVFGFVQSCLTECVGWWHFAEDTGESFYEDWRIDDV